MVSVRRGNHSSQVCWGWCAEPGWPGRALAPSNKWIQVSSPGRKRERDIPSECYVKDRALASGNRPREVAWTPATGGGGWGAWDWHGVWEKRKNERERMIRSEQSARAASPAQVSAYTLPIGPLGLSVPCKQRLLRCFPCQFCSRQRLWGEVGASVQGGPRQIEFTSLGVRVTSRGVGFGKCSKQFLPLWWDGGHAYETTAPLPSPGPTLESTEVRRLVGAKKVLTHRSEKRRKSCMNRILVEAGRQDWEEGKLVSVQLDLVKSLWHVRTILGGLFPHQSCVRAELSPTK